MIFNSWTKTIDYDEPKYITSVFTNYSSWITLTSNSAFVLNKDVLAIQYSVEMKDGWNGTARIRPSITELYSRLVR